MDFSKLFNFLGKVAKDAAKDYVGDFVEGHVNIGGNSNTSTNYDIPSEYSNFPAYPGDICRKPIEKHTENYDRISLVFKGGLNKEFYNILTSAGYQKATDVRFEKDNTYVIVENLGNVTNVVYHIKK